jgi:hypothetical protein
MPLEADIPSAIPNLLAKAIDAATLSSSNCLSAAATPSGIRVGQSSFDRAAGQSLFLMIRRPDHRLGGGAIGAIRAITASLAIRVDVCGPGARRGKDRTGMPKRGRSRRRRLIDLVFGPRIVLGW